MTNQENTLTVRPDTVYKLEPFFDLSADLLCIAGFDGYFKRINPAVSALLGYSQEELFARPIQEFIHPEDRDITHQRRENLKLNIPLLNFENRYVTKSGEIVWLSWTSMPMGSERLVYAIAKNITYKKKLEIERNALLTHLAKDMEDLRSLSYTTSHDLRSPVSNLLMVFNLLDVSRIADEETRQLVEMLRNGTHSLMATLNRQVDILKQKDRLSAEIEELNLNESLQAVLQSVNTLLKNSHANIVADFSAAPCVRFNKAYMESILLNLITNSIKYARPDRFPHISITSEKLDGLTQLIYSDNGLGFDMEKVKHRIFGLHQKFSHHHDSKGIGLYLVYKHVTSLGGTIRVESKPDQGARFTICFNQVAD